VLLALALIGLQFGHNALAPEPIDLTAYAMPDGTLPQLCLDASGTDQQAKSPCPACIIAAAVVFENPVAAAPTRLAVSLANWPAPAAPLRAAHHPRSPPARGPPLFS
jgi:hypothetical protein